MSDLKDSNDSLKPILENLIPFETAQTILSDTMWDSPGFNICRVACEDERGVTYLTGYKGGYRHYVVDKRVPTAIKDLDNILNGYFDSILASDDWETMISELEQELKSDEYTTQKRVLHGWLNREILRKNKDMSLSSPEAQRMFLSPNIALSTYIEGRVF